LDSGAHYLTVLKREEGKFNDALQNQQSLQVGTKVEERKQLAHNIAEKEAQIQRLQQEIQAMEKRDQELEGEVEEAARRVFKTKEDFHASYAYVMEQIQKDLDLMQRYLR
jgi:predicted  nucleic acid-binding Zn-ribbon protein